MERNIIRWIILLISGIQLSVNAQSYDAVLLNQITDIKIVGGKLTRTISYDVQINNRVGEKYTEIDIPYSKLLKVSKIEAQIRDVFGNQIKKLKSSNITTCSAISEISLYEDNMVFEFTLKHNVYPYILHYSYQEQAEQFLYIDYWCPVLEQKIPTLKATLTLNVPVNYRFKQKTHLVDSAATEITENGFKYTWTTKYKVLDESEIFSPDISNFLPHVKIVPAEFFFERKGFFESWMTYGNWQYEVNYYLSNLPDNEKATITSLIQGITDRNEKIKILYHYLQDVTRYINVSVKTGGMVPYPATYVSENKFGDCKALTNYFRSVLKFAGIDAFYTKVYAGSVIRAVDTKFPSQQFNHIILCVPNLNDTIWLDCTSDGPYNYLGSFTQGREALIIDKDNSRIQKTPELKPTDVSEQRYITVNYLSENSCAANFNTRLKGTDFEQLSQISRDYRKENQELIIRNNFIPFGFELIDFQYQSVHRDSVFMILNYQTKSDKLFKKYGNELIIRNIPFDIPTFKKPGERKYPVQIDFPVCKTDTQVYKIPDNYSVTNLTTNDTINSKFGKYKIEIKKENNEIRINKSVVLNAAIYSLADYVDFYNFINKVTDKENNILIVASKI
jgi:hypothetical protein